jgi:hypothetical protein
VGGASVGVHCIGQLLFSFFFFVSAAVELAEDTLALSAALDLVRRVARIGVTSTTAPREVRHNNIQRVSFSLRGPYLCPMCAGASARALTDWHARTHIPTSPPMTRTHMTLLSLLSSSQVVEFVAFVRLRQTHTGAVRQFKVPGGVWSATAVIAPGMLFTFAVMAQADWTVWLAGVLQVVLAYGMTVYFRRMKSRSPCVVPTPATRSCLLISSVIPTTCSSLVFCFVLSLSFFVVIACTVVFTLLALCALIAPCVSRHSCYSLCSLSVL